METQYIAFNCGRITLDLDHSVRYWCEKFDCTPMELYKAVNLAGDSPAAVERILEVEKQFEPAGL